MRSNWQAKKGLSCDIHLRMIIALILRNSLLWVFCPRFTVTAQKVYQFAYGILLSVPINFLPPHTNSIHHNKANCCHRRVTFDTKVCKLQASTITISHFRTYNLFAGQNVGRWSQYKMHLWNWGNQFQFVLVEMCHAMQKCNLLHSQVFCISSYAGESWPANTARSKTWQCLIRMI